MWNIRFGSHDDVRAISGSLEGDGLANSAGSAGDEQSLSRQATRVRERHDLKTIENIDVRS